MTMTCTECAVEYVLQNEIIARGNERLKECVYEGGSALTATPSPRCGCLLRRLFSRLLLFSLSRPGRRRPTGQEHAIPLPRHVLFLDLVLLPDNRRDHLVKQGLDAYIDQVRFTQANPQTYPYRPWQKLQRAPFPCSAPIRPRHQRPRRPPRYCHDCCDSTRSVNHQLRIQSAIQTVTVRSSYGRA